MSTLSVVIPSYRRLERLPALIAAYDAQGADQIVVVLDGPHPGWEARLAAERELAVVRVVALESNGGLALARIAGLEAATGDLVLITDDDVFPAPDLLARHRAAHAGAGELVVLGSMPVALPAARARDEAPTRLYAREYAAQAAVWAEHPETVLASLWGGNISLPRELYARAEALRPSIALPYNEDLDLGWRLRELGAQARYVPQARAVHHHRRTLAAFAAECVARGRAVAMLEERWGTRPPQVAALLTIPPGYHPLAARLQRSIAARDTPGLGERALTGGYHLAGRVRAWTVQDAVARVLRRPLMMRGYRLSAASTAGHSASAMRA